MADVNIDKIVQQALVEPTPQHDRWGITETKSYKIAERLLQPMAAAYYSILGNDSVGECQSQIEEFRHAFEEAKRVWEFYLSHNGGYLSGADYWIQGAMGEMLRASGDWVRGAEMQFRDYPQLPVNFISHHRRLPPFADSPHS